MGACFNGSTDNQWYETIQLLLHPLTLGHSLLSVRFICACARAVGGDSESNPSRLSFRPFIENKPAVLSSRMISETRELGMMAQAWNPSTGETKARGSQV